MTVPYLTKSRYLAGLQCSLRLWRVVHNPLPYELPAPGSPLEAGQEIGLRAHLLFSGGALVAAAPWQHAQAMAETHSLMADTKVPAIFEAALEYDGIRIRADVLERHADGSWGLVEVKSSTGVKDHYLDDIPVQHNHLRGICIAVSSISLLHVNKNYVRGPNGIDWPRFFTRLDVAADVQERLAAVRANLSPMRDALALAEPPVVKPGKHCGRPFGCEFWDDCTQDKPVDWVAKLPRITELQLEKLEALGIESIAQIPADFSLTEKQTIIRDVTAFGTPFIAPDLARLLHRFGPPALYLDFEAMMPPIPLYEGTHPYQTLPFQWSLHAIDAAGTLSHKEFLASGLDDPRRAFAESLLVALSGNDDPIIVYSSYEMSRLKELAIQFPDLAAGITAVIKRLADLLPIVRGAVYHPDFKFSNSIKQVAPALSPEFGYGDLEEIAGGGAAAAAFLRLSSESGITPEEITRLRTGLLAYCERDTLAMVEVHRALFDFSTAP